MYVNGNWTKIVEFSTLRPSEAPTYRINGDLTEIIELAAYKLLSSQYTQDILTANWLK